MSATPPPDVALRCLNCAGPVSYLPGVYFHASARGESACDGLVVGRSSRERVDVVARQVHSLIVPHGEWEADPAGRMDARVLTVAGLAAVGEGMVGVERAMSFVAWALTDGRRVGDLLVRRQMAALVAAAAGRMGVAA